MTHIPARPRTIRRLLAASLPVMMAMTVVAPAAGADEVPTSTTSSGIPKTTAPAPKITSTNDDVIYQSQPVDADSEAFTTTSAPGTSNSTTTVLGGPATPSTVAGTPTSTTSTIVPVPEPLAGVDGMADLRSRYSSLSGALIAFYAHQSGQPLSSFMATNGPAVSALTGTTLSGAQAINDVGGLNAAMAGGMAGKDFNSYTTTLSERGSSIDAAVINAGATWAQELSQLRAPALTQPTMPNMDTSAATAIPAEGLVFGMFLDKSLTAMVTDFPDLFAQTRASGIGTPGAQAAWNRSMTQALASSRPDFTAMLPSPCHGVMLTAMASGDAGHARTTAGAGGAGCGSCLATGLYLNSQVSRLFNPSSTTTQSNPTDKVIPPAEWNRMQGWQQNLIKDQNPQLSSGLDASLRSTGTGAECSSSKPAAKAAAKVTLPGVFASLNG